MSNLTTSYFAIEKADRHADGTLTVYGKATDDALDIDKQICDSAWLDRAMPHWFKSGGNIREQHSNIAAGVATDYELKTDGHYITALVVDPVSAKKVEHGVLKGFSIGIKNPRVIQDSKAANGRIVDGQIVEVSLVDRPANPNCQLVLAKSAGVDETVIQVEELIEKEEKPDYESINTGGAGSEPSDKELYNRVKNEAKAKFDVYPSAVANAWVVREYKKRGGKYRKETKKSLQLDYTEMEFDMTTAAELVAVSKSFVSPDAVKFDQKTYDTARIALANLIAIEADEMAVGDHNEQMSIAHLLEAVHHLFAWYEGEKAGGEVMEEETIIENKAADNEDLMQRKGEDREAFKKRCMKADETEEAFDKRCKMYKEAMDKEANPNPVPTEETYATLKDTVIVPPAESPKSAEADTPEVADIEPEATEEAPADETPAEEAPAEEAPKVSAEDISTAEVEAIVDQAIKSATASIKTEIASLVAAKEAALEKAVSLENELAIAKSLAVAGGPKRTGTSQAQPNDLLIKAATYKAKANATTDPVLAKGYMELHKEFLAKANNPDSKN